MVEEGQRFEYQVGGSVWRDRLPKWNEMHDARDKTRPARAERGLLTNTLTWLRSLQATGRFEVRARKVAATYTVQGILLSEICLRTQ